MSVDLIGADGTRFSRSWWTWRPIAAYAFDAAPAICSNSNHFRQWMTNDGSMTGKEAVALSRVLQTEIDTGRITLWRNPLDPEMYPFDIDSVQAFCDWLKHCGGFEVR